MNTPFATPIPLSRQLPQVAQFLAAVRAGKSSENALAGTDIHLLASSRAIGFEVLRKLGRAQFLRQHLAPKKPPAPVENLLLVALALLSSHEDDAANAASYEPHTVVNQTVQAAKTHRNTQNAAPFINACLRRFLRERDHWMAQAMQDEPARWNFPQWWIDRLRLDYPQDWPVILKESHRKAPLVLRAAPSIRADEHAISPIRIRGIPLEADRVGEFAWALHQGVPVTDIDGFANGAVSVQDGAAQLAAPLLLRALRDAQANGAPNVPRPWRVLDACAAPGGKTTHLIELAQSMEQAIEVTALDIDPQRCQRIEDNLRRCHQTAQVRAADACRPDTWWDGQPFDAILLDAPCSASGIVRRHPDVAWLRRASDIAQLAGIQSRLLDTLWPLLADGGLLLYCTCSQFKAEGTDQVQAFLSRNTMARLKPSPGHLRVGFDTSETLLPDNLDTPQPGRGDSQAAQDGLVREHDGFFYALFENPQHQESRRT